MRSHYDSLQSQQQCSVNSRRRFVTSDSDVSGQCPSVRPRDCTAPAGLYCLWPFRPSVTSHQRQHQQQTSNLHLATSSQRQCFTITTCCRRTHVVYAN